MAAGSLGDLLAATEAVGDDEPIGRSLADGWQQFEFSDRHRDVVFVFIPLEAEGAGHATASRSRSLEVDADAAQQRLFVRHLHDGLVMAVAVEQGLAFEARQGSSSGVAFEKLAEQKRLLAQGLG